MKITKTTSTTYNITGYRKNFCVFDDEFVRVRKSIHKDKTMHCFCCEVKFKDGDTVNLLITDRGNKICCNICAAIVEDRLGGSEV